MKLKLTALVSVMIMAGFWPLAAGKRKVNPPRRLQKALYCTFR